MGQREKRAFWCISSNLTSRLFIVVAVVVAFLVRFPFVLQSSCVLATQQQNNNPSSWWRRRPWKSPDYSSFFEVDPSRLLNVLVQRGGLVLPETTEKELQALASTVKVASSRLNLVERKLTLENVTLALEQHDNAAVRIGRVRIEWNSYMKPCVSVEVEQVDILVEFTNLLLTRTNWNELNSAGFPPRMLLDSSSSSSSSTSSFVRIYSVGWKGVVSMKIYSRPLKRLLVPEIKLPLDSLEDLNRSIKKASDTSTDRRGCTTDQLYDITAKWFQSKIQQSLTRVLQNAMDKPPALESLRTQVSKTIHDYARDATDKLVSDQVDRHLPPETKSHQAVKSLFNIDKIQKSPWLRNALEQLYEEPIGVEKDTYRFQEDVPFPDW